MYDFIPPMPNIFPKLPGDLFYPFVEDGHEGDASANSRRRARRLSQGAPPLGRAARGRRVSLGTLSAAAAACALAFSWGRRMVAAR